MKNLIILLACLALARPAFAEEIDYETFQKKVEEGQRKDAERDAFELADDICQQNFDAVKARFAPELWAASQAKLREAPKHCPEPGTSMKLVSVDSEGRNDAAGIFARDTYVVLAHDRSKWTMFSFVFQSSEAAAWQVESWKISESKEKPRIVSREEREREMFALLGRVAATMLSFGAIAVVGLMWFFRREHYKALRRD